MVRELTGCGVYQMVKGITGCGTVSDAERAYWECRVREDAILPGCCV